MPVLPEIFSDETFYPVAFDSFADLSGYGNAQPGPVVSTGSIKNNEIFVLYFPTEFGKLDKLIAL